MIQQTISFHDLDGTARTETFHFHMTKADVAEYMLGKADDFPAYAKDIIDRGDRIELIDLFKTLIASSVGKKSEDGKRFIKTPELRDEFMQSDAYSEFFMSLLTDPMKASAFFNGVMPADLAEAMAKVEPSEAGIEGPKTYSVDEMVAMPQEVFDKSFGTDPKKWDASTMSAAYQRKVAA